MIYLHETSTQERALVAGDNGPFDLPVNPVSFILLHLRAVIGAIAPSFDDLMLALTRVDVRFKGTGILTMSAADLARQVHTLWGRNLNVENLNGVVGDLISWTIPIPFTRRPYWSKEAFPATRRGEFTIGVTAPAVFTNITAPQISIEVVELLEAEPTQFLKMVTLSRVVAAGDSDFELPIGNPLLGLQIFSPTAMGVAPISETIRRFRLLLDNVEYQVADSSFDAHRAIGRLRGGDFDAFTAIPSLARNYVYADFDPMLDEGYIVQTEGRASVRLRMQPDVTGTVRVTPVELVLLAGGGAAA